MFWEQMFPVAIFYCCLRFAVFYNLLLYFCFPLMVFFDSSLV